MLLKSGKEPFSMLYAKFLKVIIAAISVDLNWHTGVHAKELMKKGANMSLTFTRLPIFAGTSPEKEFLSRRLSHFWHRVQ